MIECCVKCKFQCICKPDSCAMFEPEESLKCKDCDNFKRCASSLHTCPIAIKRMGIACKVFKPKQPELSKIKELESEMIDSLEFEKLRLKAKSRLADKGQTQICESCVKLCDELREQRARNVKLVLQVDSMVDKIDRVVEREDKLVDEVKELKAGKDKDCKVGQEPWTVEQLRTHHAHIGENTDEQIIVSQAEMIFKREARIDELEREVKEFERMVLEMNAKIARYKKILKL